MIFSLNPPTLGNSCLASYFPFKSRAFNFPPSPLRISVNLPRGGYGYFLEQTLSWQERFLLKEFVAAICPHVVSQPLVAKCIPFLDIN